MLALHSVLCALALVSPWLLLTARAELTGSAAITPHDYIGLGADALRYNPPACGMAYRSLDIARITAVERLEKAKGECLTCIEVTAERTGRQIYVLAVDKGGIGLDVSTPSFTRLFGQSTDPERASWRVAPPFACKGIYSGDPDWEANRRWYTNEPLASAATAAATAMPAASAARDVTALAALLVSALVYLT